MRSEVSDPDAGLTPTVASPDRRTRSPGAMGSTVSRRGVASVAHARGSGREHDTRDQRCIPSISVGADAGRRCSPACRGEWLIGLHFANHRIPESEWGSLAGDDDPVLSPAVAQLDEYFAGLRQDFDLPLLPRGERWQNRYGDSCSTSRTARPRATVPSRRSSETGRWRSR